MDDALRPLIEASWLPHALDLAREAVLFLPCDPGRIAEASFVDGRTAIAIGAPIAIPFSALLRADVPPQAGPDRMIFHVGFCGSTLLSRLLEVPGQVRVLREPNILADLANHRTALDGEERKVPLYRPLLERICALLRRPWSPGEMVIVKPSNWANTLLPELTGGDRDIRALFLTARRDEFLRAVIRGGSERLAFAARAAVHLSGREQSDAEQVSAALSAPGEDLDRLTRLAIVLHSIQVRAFARACQRAEWCQGEMLSHADMTAEPQVQATKAAKILAVGVPSADLAANCTRWANRNAKAPDRAFSGAQEHAQNLRAEQTWGERMQRALSWAGTVLGPETG